MFICLSLAIQYCGRQGREVGKGSLQEPYNVWYMIKACGTYSLITTVIALSHDLSHIPFLMQPEVRGGLAASARARLTRALSWASCGPLQWGQRNRGATSSNPALIRTSGYCAQQPVWGQEQPGPRKIGGQRWRVGPLDCWLHLKK